MNIRSSKEDKELSKHFKHIVILQTSFHVSVLSNSNMYRQIEIDGKYFNEWIDTFGDTRPTREAFLKWCTRIKIQQSVLDQLLK